MKEQGVRQSHPLLSWLRNHLNRHVLYAVLVSLVLMLLAAILLTGCGEAGPDPSGLNTANRQNLTHMAVNGTSPTITSSALSQAQTQEPFAYNLALYVDENRLAVNFVLVLYYWLSSHVHVIGFLLVEVGFCRAKNAAHTAAMNIMVYGIAIIGFFCVGFAFQFGGVGLIGVPNLGGLAGLNQEISIHIGNVNWGLLGFKGFFFNDGQL